MALLYFKVTNTRNPSLRHTQQTAKLFLKACASNFLGSEPQANCSVTAPQLVFLFCVAALELKNATIWEGCFYFSLKLAKSDWMLNTGPLVKQRLGLKPHKKGLRLTTIFVMWHIFVLWHKHKTKQLTAESLTNVLHFSQEEVIAVDWETKFIQLYIHLFSNPSFQPSVHSFICPVSFHLSSIHFPKI